MKTSSVDLKWTGNMAFETELDGHKLVVDAASSVGGEDKGYRPKPLMLVALAGCTGMDVVSILKKMRVEVEEFNVSVEADMTEEHPKQYNKMKIIYSFKGKDLPREKIEKAVNLSEEKYCGVSAVYKKAMDIATEIQINE